MLDTRLGASLHVKRAQSRCARAIFRAGIGANAATLLALVIGIGSGIAFARVAVIVAIVALAISAGFDAIDGTIARECAAPSAFGGVLDLCSDRVVETFVISRIAWRDPALYFPALLLLGSWYVNITVFLSVGAALEHHGPKLIEYPPGIIERTETLIFFVILAIVESFPILRPSGPWLCYAMALLEVATGACALASARLRK